MESKANAQNNRVKNGDYNYSTAPARKGEKNKGGRKVERKNTH